MLAGDLYDPHDPELVARRERARDLCQALNATREAESDRRRAILRDLFGAGGDTVWMQPPFFCDYLHPDASLQRGGAATRGVREAGRHRRRRLGRRRRHHPARGHHRVACCHRSGQRRHPRHSGGSLRRRQSVPRHPRHNGVTNASRCVARSSVRSLRCRPNDYATPMRAEVRSSPVPAMHAQRASRA